jgi:DNA-binding NarL/FixJ family response regulator
MAYDAACISVDQARGQAPLSSIDQLPHEIEDHSPYGVGGAKLGDFIAVIESRTFIRECIRRSVQSAFAQQVLTYSTAAELQQHPHLASAKLIVLSWAEGNAEVGANNLKLLVELAAQTPVIVLAHSNDIELARIAIGLGAKGYIPVSMGFEITIQAVRFVLAGGTYAPLDCLLPRDPPRDAPQPPKTGVVTARELSVVRAIQNGKSNKVIAYELNMCEGTVKVHVRNVMKKLNARNRTDVAIKAQTISGAASPPQPEPNSSLTGYPTWCSDIRPIRPRL